MDERASLLAREERVLRMVDVADGTYRAEKRAFETTTRELREEIAFRRILPLMYLGAILSCIACIRTSLTSPSIHLGPAAKKRKIKIGGENPGHKVNGDRDGAPGSE